LENENFWKIGPSVLYAFENENKNKLFLNPLFKWQAPVDFSAQFPTFSTQFQLGLI